MRTEVRLNQNYICSSMHVHKQHNLEFVPQIQKIKRTIIQIKLDRNRNIGQSSDRNASGLWSLQSWSVYMCSCHYSSYGIWSVSFYFNINTEKQSETQWVITPPCDLHAAVRYDKISSWHACCHVWYVGSSWAWYYIGEEKKQIFPLRKAFKRGGDERCIDWCKTFQMEDVYF